MNTLDTAATAGRSTTGSPGSPGRALAVLATAQFLAVLTTSIVNIALPQIRGGLGLSAAGLSWVVNAYVLVFGALLLLGGRLGDAYGLRRVFLSGTALFAVATLAAGLAPGATVLIAARAVQGVGAALLAPTALALVLTLYPAGAGRGRALGIWGSVSGAGGAAGVLLGGLISGAYGWRAVFLVTVPAAVAVLAAGRLLLAVDRPRAGHLDAPGAPTTTNQPRGQHLDATGAPTTTDQPRGQHLDATGAPTTTDRPRGRRLDVAGALTSTGGLIAVTYALSSLSGVGGVAAWVALGAGVALLAVFVAVQRRAAAPLVPPRVLRAGRVGAANVLMSLVGAVWIGLFFFLPLYQQRVLGFTPLEAGLTQLPLALSIIVFSWATPRLERRLPGRAVLAGALAALTAGLAWLSRAPSDGTFLADLLGPSLLIGAGLGVAFVRLTALSSAGVAPADSGVAGGLVNASRQIGGAAGLAVLTAVSGGSAYGAAFAAAAVIAALTTLLSLVL
ncbi:MFS transporter [Nonomuraea polychroma]|uniref:MFS transporter n=1 Tax=Nonomuraea polychroma TaxID=46176 RepID=A0A438LZI6_9ACTN|nr:MFS transporter [Nonomuraea polychroma]RVX38811.1 MFS transporter [Nonomuraea polychroma]